MRILTIIALLISSAAYADMADLGAANQSQGSTAAR